MRAGAALCLLLGACASGLKHDAQSRVTLAPTPPTREQLAAIGENRARAHTELGANYYLRGQYAIALDEINKALEGEANYAPAHNVRGLIYMALKEDERARRSFQEALRLDPQSSDTNNNYGWFLCQRTDPAKSLEYFAIAARNPLYETPERALANAGICARKMGNEIAAEKYFLQALESDPRQDKALYNLAEISFARGNFGAARSYLSRYLAAAAPTAESLWLAIRTEYQLHDREAEASYASQLCRRYPESKECAAVRSGAAR